MTVNDIVLKMNNISKRFDGVTVLDKVNFDLKSGEVHVLIGENGAGKSTLMKILAGVYQKSEGEMFLKNETGNMELSEFSTPAAAQQSGISMVFQEFNLINNMSVAENIYIGREPVKNGVLDRKKLYEMTKKQIAAVSLDVTPQTLVENLTVAQKQCVEIAKCLSYDAKIIILDEPTSSLSQKEVDTLFRLISTLKKKGVSIVYISHRMEEIFEIGDRITVFRDGQFINTVLAKETTKDELVKMIIGREFKAEKRNVNLKKNKEVALSGENITVGSFHSNFDFHSYKGEILGIFGLVGAGRTELARVIFGIDDIGSGKLFKYGKEIQIKNTNDAIKNKIGLVPEDRKELGLVASMNIRDNLTLVKLRELSFFLKSRENEGKITKEYIEKFHVACAGQNQQISRLSGGNQQKVAIAKWLTLNLDVIILDEPTRGVDIGAKAEIYEIMRQLANEGKSIIMISSDLPEILRVSDRVYVMHDGDIKLEAPVEELDQEKIMHAAIE